MIMIKRCVIIVAGGSGKRMKSDIPKQFILIQGKPLILHTIQRFIDFDKKIQVVVVLPENLFDTWENLCKKHKFNYSHLLVAGGKERFHSVQNAVRKMGTQNFVVAVHDAVRPMVSPETISRCFDTAEKKGTAIPVMPLKESLREITGKSSKAVERNKFYTVQTPQCFRSDILIKAYRQKYSVHFTDDASVLEKSGVSVMLVSGNIENIKITDQHDLIIAESLFGKKVGKQIKKIIS
jgi:2-C-methyl-D-erythritol 4-phosphate cytidylyltransferase